MGREKVNLITKRLDLCTSFIVLGVNIIFIIRVVFTLLFNYHLS